MDFVKSILDRLNVTMSELNDIKEKISLYILEQEKTKDFDFFDTQHEEEVASHHEEEEVVSQHEEEEVASHHEEEEVVSHHEEEVSHHDEEVVSQHEEEEVASHHEEVASQHEEEVSQHDEVASQHEEEVTSHDEKEVSNEEEYVKEEVNTKNVYNSSYSNLTSSQFTKTNKSSINNNPPQRNYRNFW